MIFTIFFYTTLIAADTGEAVRSAIARVLPAVVVIESRGVPRQKEKRQQEMGSGFVVEIDGRYYILTSGHIVSQTRASEAELFVTLHNRRIVRATQMLIDDDYDIAVLFLNVNGVTLTAANLGDSDNVDVGDTVFAIGHPFGLRESVSRGMITGGNRRRIPAGNLAMPLSGFFQTDASINPGNSGGPLLSELGEVIGLVTAIASTSGTHEGVAFAMPINVAMRVARQLVTHGRATRPMIGLELDPQFDTTARLDAGLDRAIGTRIRRVVPNSPAAQAGLLPGDIVISLNDCEIEDDLHLIQLIAASDTTATLSLRILRDGTVIEVSVTLAGAVEVGK